MGWLCAPELMLLLCVRSQSQSLLPGRGSWAVCGREGKQHYGFQSYVHVMSGE